MCMLTDSESNKVFEQLREEYNSLYPLIKNHVKNCGLVFNDVVPRTLRLFRIRLNLCLGFDISFNTRFALVKDENVRSTYVIIMQCNEAWFAFESLVKHGNSLGITQHGGSAINKFNENSLSAVPQILECIRISNRRFRETIYSETKRVVDIENYLKFLQNGSRPRVRDALVSAESKISNNLDLEHFELLSIIYATRNLFVHEGETAKSGIKNYRNKIRILEITYDYLILLELSFLVSFYSEIIEEYNIS